jgi:glycosyltransferase involved in cell wall biosynthesis/GT2 family glycosyltransferase/SAM-dependent methyltransferase
MPVVGPKIVCVLGMHRSGTSLVSRLINLLGLDLGPADKLLPPHAENPRGYWEYRPFVDINEQVLERLGGSWHEPPTFVPGWEASPNLADLRRQARALVAEDFRSLAWAWKDPRTCLTLPFWRQLLPPLRYVICLRNPAEVAKSLAQRDRFAVSKSIDLWHLYTKSSLEHAQGPTLFLFYEDLLESRDTEVGRLAAFVGSDAQSTSIQERIEAELHHQRTAFLDTVDDEECAFPAKALYVALRLFVYERRRSCDGPAAAELGELWPLFSRRTYQAQIEAREQVRKQHECRASFDEAQHLLQEARDRLAERERALTEELAQRDAALSNLGAAVAAKCTQIEVLSERKQALERTVEGLRKDIADQLTVQENQAKQATAAHATALRELQTERDHLMARLADTEEHARDLEEQVATGQRRLKAQQARLEVVRERLALQAAAQTSRTQELEALVRQGQQDLECLRAQAVADMERHARQLAEAAAAKQPPLDTEVLRFLKENLQFRLDAQAAAQAEHHQEIARLGADLEEAYQQVHLGREQIAQLEATVPQQAEELRQLRYRELLTNVRASARASLPREAKVLVISKGDEALLQLEACEASHFPQDEKGEYLWHYPATSEEAIANLESLRAKGATHLLVPDSARWWLDHYDELREHLARHYRVVLGQEDSCLIFVLHEPTAAQAPEENDNSKGPGPRQEAGSARTPTPYNTFQANNRITPPIRSALSVAARAFAYQPTISILMPVYNVDLVWLKKAIDSVKCQIYPRWELCIADDASTSMELRNYLLEVEQDRRIKVVFRQQNGHICAATNSAAELATGDLVAFMDNDDALAPNALFEVVRLMQDHPDADVIYSDEDKMDETGRCYDPQFKPDWSAELLLAYNYINHFTCVRRSVFERVGRLRIGYEGSQDYDLLLRVVSQTDRIYHVPQVLYHWRALATSTAASASVKPIVETSGRRALEDHLQRLGIAATVYQPEYAARLRLPINQLDWADTGPMVGIIIPTHNQGQLLLQCVESILTKTTYENYQIVVIDNDSDDPETLQVLRVLEARGVRVEKISNEGGRFSFSRINNLAVQRARTDLVLLLNNDTKVVAPKWLSRLVGYLSLPGVGATGARLLYPDGNIQHAGIVLGMHNGTAPGHAFAGRPGSEVSYYFLAEVARPCAAVTAACLLTRREDYLAVGGLDEKHYAVSCNDVDYCQRLSQKGLRTVYVAGAELLHHESMSRGREDDPAELVSFQRAYGRGHDRYYGPNLSSTASYQVDTGCHLDYAEYLRRPCRALMISHNLNLEGAPRSLYELAAGLQARGRTQPIVFSCVGGMAEAWYRDAGIEVLVRPFPDCPNMIEGWRSEDDYMRAVQVLQKTIEEVEPDVVVANTLHAFCAIDAASRCGVPSIWIIRESYPAAMMRQLIAPFELVHCEPAFQQANRVVFVSTDTRELFDRYNAPHNQVVLPNGLDSSRIDTYQQQVSRDDAARHIQAPHKKKIAVSVGTICARKDQQTFVRAAALLKRERSDFCCYLVGLRRGDPYCDEVEHMVKEGGLDDVVHLVPETEEVFAYYRAADVFVFTSHVEAFSRTILEAEAFGLPIITTPCAGTREQVRGNVNALLFGMSDAEGLASYLRALFDNDEQRARMGANSRHVFASLWTYDDMVHRYEELLLGAMLHGPEESELTGSEAPPSDRPGPVTVRALRRMELPVGLLNGEGHRLPWATGVFEEISQERDHLAIAGWMYLPAQPCDSIALHVNGTVVGTAQVTMRSDVAAAFPDISHAAWSGFAFAVPRSVLGPVEVMHLDLIGSCNGAPLCRFDTLFRADLETGLPVPPPELMEKVTSHRHTTSYLLDGFRTFGKLLEGLQRSRMLSSIGRALDWRCGCGELTVHWLSLPQQVEVFGCDPRPECIEWCGANLQPGSFEVMGPGASVPFSSRFFDLVTTSSSLHDDYLENTHWLQEVHRVLIPGGLFVAAVPTHGRSVSENGEVIDLQIGACGEVLEVLEHVPRGVGTHHDLLILRRRF